MGACGDPTDTDLAGAAADPDRLWRAFRAAGLTMHPGVLPDPRGMSHHFTLRVYYEDTDLAGIVYYANYLKFIERARTEWVRGLGIDQSTLKSAGGLVFAVRRVEVDYLKPARFDDELRVETRLASLSPARILLDQDIFRVDDKLTTARVTLVCLTATGRAARLPADIRRRLAALPP